MQFALLISVVIALILGAFLLLTHVQSFFKIKSNELIQASEIANQHILQSLGDSLKTGDTISSEQQQKTLKLNSNFYGAWTKVYAQVQSHNRKVHKSALVGTARTDRSANLYLANTNSPLVVVGNTRIEGNAYVPKQGLKAGNISGNYYQGSRLYYGSVFESKTTLPQLKKEWISYLESLSNGSFIDNLDNITLERDIENSFYTSGQIIISPSTIVLGNEKIAGNIIIQSNTAIVVEPTATLQNVILVAPKIIVKDNTKGTMQLFASQKLTIGKNCYFNYPSTIAFYDQTRPSPTQNYNTQNRDIDFSIDKGTLIEGSVVYLQKHTSTQNRIKTHLKMAPGTEVIGEIYCQGSMDFEGIVRGAVYTQQFIANQSGSIYLNHIYNGKILTNPIPNYAGLPFENTSNSVAQWLY
ncbi:hypothetical protein [Aquimarina spongiae]|uniref:Uncharacterized protein n=1 Tax=Aquimarina spongiae TaxID=570521 RepID=A0A1M6EKR0_9FLAO|nr:hypothetical protein [Aquimarina spongiae]SHI86125.1 hypothetical protein SAMN04488508_103457 [Aquimarina spongiae]